nr:Peptidyl-prolyl cis-trans isomerase cyp15 [Polyrhizophydium stewartii]
MTASKRTHPRDDGGEEQLGQPAAQRDEQHAGAPASRSRALPAVAAAEDDDDDIGPMPVSAEDAAAASAQAASRKKQRTLEHEALYLGALPSTDMYEVSLMHRDVVNFVFVASRSDFILTTSVDGHVKFWKKTDKGVEFVKHFRAHLGAIVAAAVSHDGTLFATAGVDKGLKIFDVVNFDMINMIKLPCLPNALAWVYRQGDARALLACSDKESSAIHLFDGRGGVTPLCTLDAVHAAPISIMRFNPLANTVVSVDEGGQIEYWVPEPDSLGGFTHPSPPAVAWELKSQTDLYEFKKAKTTPTCLEFSPDYSKFVTFGFDDRQVRIFNFRTGKLMRKYDESMSVASEMQQAGTAIHRLDDMEFGRRLAVERDIEKTRGGQAATANAVFDESGNFVIYPTLIGIKVVNIRSNKVTRLIGKSETQRFMNIALYQGAPKKKAIVNLTMAASENPLHKEAEATDPTLFCTSYKKNRFFLFTRREPDTANAITSASGGRDIFNEKPSREEQTVAANAATQQAVGTLGIIHTTLGDIHVRLFPEYAPKAVENFAELARRGYYNNVIFHRVIKGFMLQTGDPFGDGTGGESCWGSDFEDEFHRAIKHDRPYTLSMANCGPNTNGSQFFITVAPTPWLDNKHTIFGRATAGMDVIHRIENLAVDKNDKPHDEVRIMSIDVR